MAKQIQRLQRNQAPSLIQTEKGNELIDRVNALSSSIGQFPIIVEEGPNGEGSLLIRLANQADQVEPNASFAVCKNGTAYYADFVIDADTGLYPVADGPNFPIEEPT